MPVTILGLVKTIFQQTLPQTQCKIFVVKGIISKTHAENDVHKYFDKIFLKIDCSKCPQHIDVYIHDIGLPLQNLLNFRVRPCVVKVTSQYYII